MDHKRCETIERRDRFYEMLAETGRGCNVSGRAVARLVRRILEENEMALKDTLERRQRELTEAQSFDKAAVIGEWRKTVGAFISKIEEFLEEYRKEGTLQFERGEGQVNEEMLGAYQVPQMTLRAGSAVLMVQPFGRMIIGANGRVDLYRQGRGAKNERVMALHNAPNNDSEWILSIPPEDNSFKIMDASRLASSRQRVIVPFNKKNLESALDRLLQ